MARLFTVLVACLAITGVLSEYGWSPGKEYRYLLKGHELSGIPDISPQYVGLELRADVIIQSESRDTILMKLEDVRLGKLNDVISEAETREFGSEELSTEPLDLLNPRQKIPFRYEKLEKHVEEAFSKPIKIKMKRGVMQQLEVPSEDPIWIDNVRKSIASMLSLDMSKENLVQSEEDSYRRSSASSDMSYTSHEESIIGDCETSYTVVPLPSDVVYELEGGEESQRPKQQAYSIKKVRDLDRCRHRPSIKSSSSDAVGCDPSSSHCKLLTTKSSSSETIIRGDLHNFIIERVQQQGAKTIIPSTSQKDHLMLISRQILKLKKIGKSEKKMSSDGSTVKTNLLMSTEKHEQFLKKPSLDEAPHHVAMRMGMSPKELKAFTRSEKIVEKISSSLREAVKELKSQSPKPSEGNIMGRLITIKSRLEELTKDQLETVYEYTKKSENPRTEKKLLVDLLTMAGTNPSIRLLIDLIREESITKHQAMDIIVNLPSTIKTPTPEIMKELYKLYKSDCIQKNTLLRYNTIIALSRIIKEWTGSHISQYRRFSYKKLLSKDDTVITDEIIPKIIQELRKSESDVEKIVYLKALGNTGQKSTIRELGKYVSSECSREVKIAAIKSLKSLPKESKKEVRDMLLPVIHSPTEKPEVRSVALEVLFSLNPSVSMLQKIIMDTYSDPSRHFSSLVSSAISSMADAYNPKIHSNDTLQWKAKMLMPLVRSDWMPMSYSKMYYFSIPKEDIFSRSEAKLQVLSGSESMQPSSIEFSYTMNNRGLPVKVIDLEFRSEGIQSILNILFGPEGIYQTKQSPFDILSRDARGVSSVEEELRDINKKLNIEQRQEEESMAFVDIKSGSSERFIDIGEEILEELQEEGQLSISDISKKLEEEGTDLEYHRLMNLRDTEIYYPSELGLPVFINIQSPVLASVDGKVKASFEPGLFQSSRNGKPISSIKVKVNGTSKLMNKYVCLIGVVYPPEKDLYMTAVTNEVSLNLPSSLYVDIKPEERRVDWEVSLKPNKEQEMVSIHTHPVTSIISLKSVKSINETRSSKAIRLSDKDRRTSVMETPLGLRVKTYRDNDRRGDVSHCLQSINNLISGKDVYLMGMPISLEHRYYGISVDTKLTRRVGGSVKIEMRKSQETSQDKLMKKSKDSYWSSSIEAVSATFYTSGQRYMNHSIKIDLKNNLKIFLDNITTPILDVENIKSPEIDLENRRSLLTENIDTENRIRIRYGREPLLNITLKKERTEEMQQKLEKSQNNKNCEKDENEGRSYSTSCKKIKDLAAMANKISLKIDTSRANPQIKSYITREMEKLGDISMLLDMMMNHGDKSPKITTDSNTQTMSIQYPSSTKTSMSLTERVMRSGLKTAVRHVLGEDLKPTCTVDRHQVTTFDQVEFNYAVDDCWHVAVKDCSDKTNMAVLVKKGQDSKHAKVLIRNLKFELSRSSVKVNEQEQQLEVGEVMVVRESRRELAAIEKISDTKVIFTSPEYGLEVTVTPDPVRIHLTTMYRKNVCGLCGNMDGEKMRDLMDPQMKIYKDSKYFGLSYSIPDGQCKGSQKRKSLEGAQATKVSDRPHHLLRSTYDMRSSHDADPVKVTDAITVGDQICFSTRPVYRCSQDHVIDRWEKIDEMPYHCVKSSRASRHMEQRAIHDVIDNIADKHVDMRVSALTAKSCIHKSQHKYRVPKNKIMGCYIDTRSNRRQGEGRFDIETVDPHMCSHIYYAFATLDTNSFTIKPRDEFKDLPEKLGKGGYVRFNGLKKINTELKTMLSVGGEEDSSQKFSRMAQTPETRKSFIMSLVELLKKYNFDGMDLVWEYPTMKGGRPEDKSNYVQLLKELREVFNEENFVLSVALPGKTEILDAGYDIELINRYVDFVNVMSYDYHGMWESTTGLHSPLYGRTDGDQRNLHFTATYLLQRGLEPNKLVVGMALYGRGFTLSDPSHHGLGDPVTGGIRPGPFTDEVGLWGDNELCKEKQENPNKWIHVWDDTYKTTYAYSDRDWIGFDNPKALTMKAEFVKEHDLGGAMVFSLDTDDFRGNCFNRKFHMTRTITDVLNRDTEL